MTFTPLIVSTRRLVGSSDSALSKDKGLAGHAFTLQLVLEVNDDRTIARQWPHDALKPSSIFRRRPIRQDWLAS